MGNPPGQLGGVLVASFDEWLDAYEVVYRMLPVESDHQCPNCGHRTLRMVFTTPPAPVTATSRSGATPAWRASTSRGHRFPPE